MVNYSIKYAILQVFTLQRNQCTDLFTSYGASDIPINKEVANDNRLVFFHCQANCGFIHHSNIWVAERFLIGESVVLSCRRILVGVGIVHAIYFGSFYHHLTVHFQCQVYRSRIGRQEGTANTATDNYHATLTQVMLGTPMGILVHKLIYFNATQRRGGHVFSIKDVRYDTCIHNRREHAGVMRCHSADAITGQLRSSCIITTTDYHDYLCASRYDHP